MYLVFFFSWGLIDPSIFLFRQRDQMESLRTSINEKQLFHGTNSKHVDSICRNNFDWRLCGTNGTSFGKGWMPLIVVYFVYAMFQWIQMNNCCVSKNKGCHVCEYHRLLGYAQWINNIIKKVLLKWPITYSYIEKCHNWFNKVCNCLILQRHFIAKM